MDIDDPATGTLVIRIPPCIAPITNALPNKSLASAPHQTPCQQTRISPKSDPQSISATQCRCCLTTQTLTAGEDAVYQAVFGSHTRDMAPTKKRYLKVALLHPLDAIPLNLNFAT